MRSILDFVKRNWDKIIGAATAFFAVAGTAWTGDLARLFTQYPQAASFLCVAFLAAGYVAGRTSFKELSKYTEVKEICTHLSDKERAIVLECVEKGSIRLSHFDSEANALACQGILCMPPAPNPMIAITFKLERDVASLIRRNAGRWIKPMGKDERKDFIERW